MLKVYGIPNCNTVKKALDYLELKKIKFEFINFKKSPPTNKLITAWKKDFGELPVNTKGPTFRKIKEDFENSDARGKMKLLIENSSAIKRPIIEKNGKALFKGFDEDQYKELFK